MAHHRVAAMHTKSTSDTCGIMTNEPQKHWVHAIKSDPAQPTKNLLPFFSQTLSPTERSSPFRKS
jgi:hypothetical protein